MTKGVYEGVDVNSEIVVEDHVVEDAENGQVGVYDADVNEGTQVHDLDVLQVDGTLKVHCP